MQNKLNEQNPPIFILGVQRSGTTLLRLILNSHSHIAIPEESTFLMPLLKKKNIKAHLSGKSLKALVNYLSLNSQLKLWNYDCSDFLHSLSEKEHITLKNLIEEMFRSYCRNNSKSIWGDKTPSFFRKIDILNLLFPDAKFIHIIRDGRDVFDSWRKMDPSKKNVAVAAIEWRYKLSKIEKSLRFVPDKNRLTIRYEDLLEQPEIMIESICSFLGIAYESDMLDFYRKSHCNVGEHHSHLIFQPINKNNKEKWRKNLTVREVKTFSILSGHFLKKYSYEIPDESITVSDILFIIKNLFWGFPKRILQVFYTKILIERSLRKGLGFSSPTLGKMPKNSKKS